MSSSVVWLITQPLVLHLEASDGLAKFDYRPDALAYVRHPRTGELLYAMAEAKLDDTYLLDPVYSARLAHVKKLLSRIGITFSVITKEDLPDTLEPLLDTVARWRKYWGAKSDLLLLSKVLTETRFERMGDLVAAVGRPLAYHALATHRVHVDHFAPLNDDSRLYEHLSEAHDAARHLYAGR